jgi:thiamine kinase-like enzyme
MLAQSELIDAVAGRIPAWRGRTLTVEPLRGGMTNASYVVSVDGRRHVVRHGVDDPALLGVDRENERANTEIAGQLGIGPRVVALLPELGVLVVEFLEGRTLSAADLRRPGMARRLGATLGTLHAGPPFGRGFDMFRLIDGYLATLDRLGVPPPVGYPARLPAIRRIERALSARRLPPVPCHNDLVAENVIDDGNTLRLVDWEYSGNGDPDFELGNACRELDYDEADAGELVDAYLAAAAVPAPVSRATRLARLRLFGVVADAGWTLWASIQAARARLDVDFVGYGAGRWARAEAALDSPGLGDWLDRAESTP